jgi:tRNA-Thr(GGU) m(6)t(6)A37 methyltransferase TsaA
MSTSRYPLSDRVQAVPASMALRPVGRVSSEVSATERVALSGGKSIVEVFPEFKSGLHRIQEYGHLWIVCWFHLANRDNLLSFPKRVNPELPEYGVFALRCPGRPNPLAMSLVRLDAVEGSSLHVSGLDAVDGTPVVDIKPYNEHDSVLSPEAPYFPAADPRQRREWLRVQAVLHHQEECRWLDEGLDFALEAEEAFGNLQASDLLLTVVGPPCLADVMQGLTRARFAHPARLRYCPSEAPARVIWTKGQRVLVSS